MRHLSFVKAAAVGTKLVWSLRARTIRVKFYFVVAHGKGRHTADHRRRRQALDAWSLTIDRPGDSVM
jgi:hypothetical protein